MLLVAFLVLLLPTLAWATFLNSFFIFARDASFLFTILDDPMSFCAGVRIPPQLLPLWIRIAGAIFPLTGSLFLLRAILLENATLTTVWSVLAGMFLQTTALFVLSAWLLQHGERHARQTGSLALF